MRLSFKIPIPQDWEAPSASLVVERGAVFPPGLEKPCSSLKTLGKSQVRHSPWEYCLLQGSPPHPRELALEEGEDTPGEQSKLWGDGGAFSLVWVPCFPPGSAPQSVQPPWICRSSASSEDVLPGRIAHWGWIPHSLWLPAVGLAVDSWIVFWTLYFSF